MAAYYNEFDPFAAAWLRELIKDGLIADGVVDERSILDVEPNDLKGFTQHHFFAGIGGWSYALRLAGWSDSRPVCTASLPCQPFSTAGNQKGKDDERHLLPHFMELVRGFGGFDVIFGEQVESAIRHGWLDDLYAEMGAEGYATGAAVLGAHSVNAPHKRQRLYWVAHTGSQRLQGHGRPEQEHDTQGWQEPLRHSAESGVNDSTVGDTEHDGSLAAKIGRGIGEAGYNDTQGQDVSREFAGAGRPESARNLRHWEDSRLIYCRDGKYRPIPTEPSLFPLANGLPNRMGILRGAGNAIVPQVAAEVIKAYMELDNA